MEQKPYPSDLSDAEWAILEPLLPAEQPIGSPSEVELRSVINALMYVSDNSIKWRAMPHDFPASANHLWLLPTLDTSGGVGAN